MSMPKISVAVLYGGRSGEHEVSLMSAASVIKHFNRTQFHIIPIGLDREGHWWLNQIEEVDALNGAPLKVVLPSAKQIEPLGFFAQHSDYVVFPVMHGTFCEDGKLQGLLEYADIPYVGAGVLSSALCMDKHVAKRLMIEAGLPTVPYMSFNQSEWQRDSAALTTAVFATLGSTVFVKPVNMGSSVGCHKVKRAEDLAVAIADAFLYDTKIIIEKAINAREIECSVLENREHGQAPKTSVLGEIITKHEFYDYEAKYHDDSLQLVIPAHVDANVVKEMQQIAAKAFTVLECEGMARVDFFVDKDTKDIYLNELNTLPGFTSVSMYPMMWQKSGLAYPDLLAELVILAQLRHHRRAKLKVTYD